MRIPPLALLVICALCIFLGWKTNGWRLEGEITAMERDLATAKATQTTTTLQKERETAQAAHDADAAPAAAQKEQQAQARVIIKEVIRYVQTPVAAQPLPAEWVQIHDAAATGMPGDSSAASGPVAATGDAANPVSNGEAIGVISSNYDTCRQEMIRISRWQAWWNIVKPQP